jgi:hypothetical protein
VITSLAADATHAYWTRRTGEILRAPLGGGDVETLAKVDPEPMALAVTADALCVAIARSGAVNPDDFGKGSIVCMKKAPGATAEIVADGFLMPMAIAAEGPLVHWLATTKKKGSGMHLFSAPRIRAAGSAPPVSRKVAAMGLGVDLEVKDGGAYMLWALGGAEMVPLKGTAKKRAFPILQGGGIALGDGKVVLVGVDDLTRGARAVVKAFPEEGGAATVLASDLDDPKGVAVAKGTAYVALLGTVGAKYKDGEIVAVPLAGGPAVRAATAQWQPGRIVASPKAIVWVNDRGNVVAHDGDAEIATLPL